MTSAQPLTDRDDPELMLEAQEDPRGAAFQTLYERHSKPVLQFLTGMLRDRALAEDTLQETFFRVYRSRERYDAERPFRPWLYRIARNAALTALKQKRAGAPLDVADGVKADSSEEPPRKTSRKERIAQTREALQVMPDDQRALLLQRYGLGMKLKELASSWSCTERTVRNRLHAACAELAGVLSESQEGPA